MMHLRTKEEVLHEFRVRGISISAWAQAMGFSGSLVYQVIAGKKQGVRGQCHQIAVTLGLKKGVVGNLRDLPFERDRPMDTGIAPMIERGAGPEQKDQTGNTSLGRKVTSHETT